MFNIWFSEYNFLVCVYNSLIVMFNFCGLPIKQISCDVKYFLDRKQ